MQEISVRDFIDTIQSTQYSSLSDYLCQIYFPEENVDFIDNLIQNSSCEINIIKTDLVTKEYLYTEIFLKMIKEFYSDILKINIQTFSGEYSIICFGEKYPMYILPTSINSIDTTVYLQDLFNRYCIKFLDLFRSDDLKIAFSRTSYFFYTFKNNYI